MIGVCIIGAFCTWALFTGFGGLAFYGYRPEETKLSFMLKEDLSKLLNFFRR